MKSVIINYFQINKEINNLNGVIAELRAHSKSDLADKLKAEEDKRTTEVSLAKSTEVSFCFIFAYAFD
jgi:hypothetical protein